ncbi:MAG: hypothetical protein JXA03_00970 [Bacteroidales bacterium]|nr:hypothetical protein [Bacteroidales bacterium]
MKKSVLLAFMLVFLVSFRNITAQDCRFYFPSEEGSMVEMTNYDEKDKMTGTVKHTIKSKKVTGNNVALEVHFESYDEKGKESGSGDLGLRCENGVFYMDMRNYMNDQMMEGYQDMDVKIEATDLEFPSDLDVGISLSDASIKITTEGSPMASMATTVNITERKVESKEPVTTPAGTFECFKITYTLKTKVMMMNVESKGVEWIAESVGAVRTESYNKKGKLMGYSVLTAIKR